VFLLGQAPGVAVATTLVPDAVFVLLLLELHAAVNASRAMTRIKDSFRNIPFPPIGLIQIIEG